MSRHVAAFNELIKRAERVGWKVSERNNKKIIHAGDGAIIPLHESPSDLNAVAVVMRKLKHAGLMEAEAKLAASVAASKKIKAEQLKKDEAMALSKAGEKAARAAREEAVRRAAGTFSTENLLDCLFSRTKPFTSEEVRPYLLKPQRYPVTLWVEVDPPFAMELHKRVKDNRPVRDSHVNKLAREMQEDRWVMVHSGVAMNQKGHCYDAQHRLLAAIQANIPIEFNISTGFSDAAKPVTDVGLKRSLSDVLYWMGISNSIVVAGSLALLWKYNQVITSGERIAPTHDQAVALLKKEKHFLDAVREGNTIAQDEECPATSTALAVFIHLVKTNWGPDPMLDVFLKQMRGEGGDAFSKTIRRIFIEGKDPDPGVPRISNIQMLATLVKAWGTLVTGHKPRSYKWLLGEPMPRIIGRAELSAAKLF